MLQQTLKAIDGVIAAAAAAATASCHVMYRIKEQ